MANIIYINYIDMTSVNSGSGVRPVNIYRAMLELGHNVELISGKINRGNIAERKRYLTQKIAKIKQNKYDVCYIEPMTGPLYKGYNRFEYEFIKEIHKLGIPIGIFYRDVYWKFKKEFKLKGLRTLVMSLFQRSDLMFYKKYCKAIFLPTAKMNDYVKARNFALLPPACVKAQKNEIDSFLHRAIYVGGVSESYGTQNLLKAFSKINETQKIELSIVCRKEEWHELNIYDYDGVDWLSVKHISGEELIKEYEKCDVSICPLAKIAYYDFCMPIKLYEYISMSKPMIVTDCDEMSKLVTQNALGIVCDDNPEAIKEAALELYADIDNYKIIADNMYLFASKNMWTDRVNTLISVLCGRNA